MKFIDKLCGKMGIMDADDDIADGEEEIEQEQPKEKKEMAAVREKDSEFPGNVVDFHSHSSPKIEQTMASYKLKVIVIEPKSFDDAQQVANCMREKRPVVINFEKTESEVAKRILDFISGTTYALNGEIKKVGRNVFLCAPSNVNVAYTEEDKKGTTEMPWLGKH